MIDYNNLERLRKEYLNKVLFFSIIYAIAIIYCSVKYTYWVYVFPPTMVITVVVSCLIILYIHRLNKKFETIVKRECLPSMLKNFCGEEDKIYWKEKKEYTPKEIFSAPDYIIDGVDFDTKYVIDNFYEGTPYDDTFFGTYKGINFAIIETKGGGKSGFHRGNVICIELNQVCNDEIYLFTKGYYKWKWFAHQGTTKYHEITIKGQKYDVYSRAGFEIKKFINNMFLGLANKLNEPYNFVFKDGYLYILTEMTLKNSKYDYFKLGSLFKKVYDGGQLQKFKNDFKTYLKIVEDFSGLQY